MFSKEIEYLTFTANAYMNLNYPHNNSHYFFNIGAISLEKFKIGGNILGGEINSTSLISINNEFVEDYLGKASHLKEHVIVDLDNSDILFAKFNENDNYEKINKLIGEIYEENNDNNNIEDTNLYIEDLAGTTIGDIRSKCRKLANSEKGLDLQRIPFI